MRTLRDESGETLVEILMTIIVIAIAMVAIVAALGSSIIASDAHRSMATGEVVLRDYADAVKAKATTPIADAAYVRCPTLAQFKTAYNPTAAEFTPPTGWSVDIASIEYWLPDAGNFPNGTFANSGGTPWTQSDCSQNMVDRGCPVDIQTCDPAFDPGFWRVTIHAFNARTDYGKENLTSRILVRRGTRP